MMMMMVEVILSIVIAIDYQLDCVCYHDSEIFPKIATQLRTIYINLVNICDPEGIDNYGHDFVIMIIEDMIF